MHRRSSCKEARTGAMLNRRIEYVFNFDSRQLCTEFQMRSKPRLPPPIVMTLPCMVFLKIWRKRSCDLIIMTATCTTFVAESQATVPAWVHLKMPRTLSSITNPMDPDERQNIFEDSVSAYFEVKEDALWLYHSVRRRFRAEFPDDQLPSTQRPLGENMTTRVTNENSRIEGNQWNAIKVTTSCHRFVDHFIRRRQQPWETT